MGTIDELVKEQKKQTVLLQQIVDSLKKPDEKTEKDDFDRLADKMIETFRK